MRRRSRFHLGSIEVPSSASNSAATGRRWRLDEDGQAGPAVGPRRVDACRSGRLQAAHGRVACASPRRSAPGRHEAGYWRLLRPGPSRRGGTIGGCPITRARDQRCGVNYARHQQYRRLARAGRLGLASAAAALIGLLVVVVGAAPLGLLLMAVAGALGLRARRWLSLAGRSGVGACSEDEMQRALAPLRAERWRLRHSLTWQGRGDIDSVAIAPTGIAVAIETKTRTYDARHLAQAREQAAWLSRRRRRWARNGALGVMCVVRARGVDRVEEDVLVVSLDRLTHVLRVAAGMDPDANSRP